jgi:hypothetical protein
MLHFRWLALRFAVPRNVYDVTHWLISVQVLAAVEEKTVAGDEHFEAKKYGDALAAYDEALKALPARHKLVADLHASKAAVLLNDKK